MQISSTNSQGESTVIHESKETKKPKKSKKSLPIEEVLPTLGESPTKVVEKEVVIDESDDEERKKEEKIEKKRQKQQDKAVANALLKDKLQREAKEEAILAVKKEQLEAKEALKLERKRKREENAEKKRKKEKKASFAEPETKNEAKSLDNAPPAWFQTYMTQQASQTQTPTPPPTPSPPAPKPFERPPQPEGPRRSSVVSQSKPSMFATMFPGRKNSS